VKTIKTLCAWCQKILVSGDDPGPISHGICPECEKKMRLEVIDLQKLTKETKEN
jgi:hypothetical protein